MNNYEYIIACLPVISSTEGAGVSIDASALLDDIRSQCSGQDVKVIDFLCRGFDGSTLDEGFYQEALKHKNRFIREYFAYDLDIRNTKVEFLNTSLGRAAGLDIVLPERLEEQVFDGREEVDAVLCQDDILTRERGLDDLMWNKIDEITSLDILDLDLILGFIAKLQITDRWLKLDEATGREMFRKIVTGIRKTYDNKKNNI